MGDKKERFPAPVWVAVDGGESRLPFCDDGRAFAGPLDSRVIGGSKCQDHSAMMRRVMWMMKMMARPSFIVVLTQERKRRDFAAHSPVFEFNAQ